MEENHVKIGLILREKRLKRGWSQEDIGEKFGVTFQQIQKYEKGYNKVNCIRLNQMAKLFECPLSDFFEEEDLIETMPKFDSKQIIQLVRAFKKCSTKGKRLILMLAEFVKNK